MDVNVFQYDDYQRQDAQALYLFVKVIIFIILLA